MWSMTIKPCLESRRVESMGITVFLVVGCNSRPENVLFFRKNEPLPFARPSFANSLGLMMGLVRMRKEGVSSPAI